MRHPILRRLLLGLLLLTFVSGPWLSAAQAAAKPCTMMMAGDGGTDAGRMSMADTGKPMPCHDSTPACMKRICCAVGATLLAPPPPGMAVLSTGVVRYLPMISRSGGRSVEPELFPPITA